jgi:hypothetical protein
MEIYGETVIVLMLAVIIIGVRLKAIEKKLKRDKKFVMLQGQAMAYLLQEFPELEAYDLKPDNATSAEWWYVVNIVYNPAPAFANPF